ncbi:unnamed protein product [Adineta steineri]|uniref:Uncharacterized protein n=1 Tax=Adineta steineri TaxID=433720 RepID=A0A819KFX1_9BILA|nr:unnamed protein product [Adineta steineri]CAF3946374.1 unnamed protein product [Adineta steineri]
MEFNSGVSMFLPDSIGLNENDFDEEDNEDIVHEQTNQNEIVELIMAAFEGHEEPSDGDDDEDDEDDDDDDESMNTSNLSHHHHHHISNDHEILNTNNNNNNNNNEHYVQQQQQQQHEILYRNHLYQQPLYSTPAVSTPPPLVPPSATTDVRRFDDHTQYTQARYQQFNDHNKTEQEIPFTSKSSALVHYQNPNRQLNHTASTTAVQYFDSLPTIDLSDPMQTQYMYQTSTMNSSDAQNQINKYRILCNAKDRRITELENLSTQLNEKYKSEIRVLKHKNELSERAKYDSDQRYQSITRQCEELIETNNQLQRTIKDAELRIQQLEGNKTQLELKLDEAESIIDSLHKRVNELQKFDTIARTQQDCELVLSSTREKHEQEILNLNEKLQMIQMNLQEKTTEVDELRMQLETACKNNEKAIFERMESISNLNQRLHDCQRQYTDLLSSKSMETFNETETKRQLMRLTEEKEKVEYTCQELQSEIRTLRERLGITEHEVNNDLFGISSISVNELSSINRQVVPHNSTSFDNPNDSLINENHHLKDRIDEFASNEKNLIEINEELQRQIQELTRKDSTSSDEIIISNSIHMEQIHSLTKQIEILKKDYKNLQEKYDYETQELQTIIEQLREDITDLDKTKQLYIDVCQEKNSIEDNLRAKFEYEIKLKLDDLRRTFEKDYNDKILNYKSNYEQDNHVLKSKYNQDLEQQTKELKQEIERIKINHEKMIHELNIELDRLRSNDDAKNRLTYVEKEFEQLKHDYSDLHSKQKELIHNCKTLEDENQNLLQTIEQFDREKTQLQTIEEKYSNEIQQLNELIEKQKYDLLNLSSRQHIDKSDNDLKQNVDDLQTRIHNYENAVSQYEEYRLKLETNLQKITQQRDTNKMDLRLTRDILTNKESEYNQIKIRFDETEKHLQEYKERQIQNDKIIHDLEKQIEQYEQQILELNQTKLKDLQEKEIEYHDKFVSIQTEKNQFEQRLQEANRALNLADSHLKQEIEKIKLNLEQEYNRRYERDQKQHQNDLQQLRQQLTNDFEKQKTNLPIIQSHTSAQDIEEVKKMYRTEIDRLYRENIELNQNQAKLIDTHSKQMQIMKKDLDDGYNNVINEFQHEQTRLQTRCEQLKQQLNDTQQIIEQLKKNHSDDITKIREKVTLEQDNRNRQENLQNRLDHLVKLLEQSNESLNQERQLHTKQENEYQQTISSLQKKIADMIKQHTKAMDEIKQDLHQERVSAQKRTTTRPICVPEYVQTDLSLNDIKSDYIATIEKLRVGIAHYMDNLETSVKKQMQNELVRSRNSMIKEIRRELFEKMTFAMRSQGVPDTTIDMHVFELDRLLSQMAQDCLNALSTSSSTSSSIYSTVSSTSSLTTPQRRSIIYDSSSSTNLSKSKFSDNNHTPLRKSIECLYITPTASKQTAPLAPHCQSTLDDDRRPKSASTTYLASQNSSTPTVLLTRTHKSPYQTNKNFNTKMYRSEDDLMAAMQRHDDQQKTDLDDADEEDADTIVSGENDDQQQQQQPNVRALARQFEQKTNSLPGHNRSKTKVLDSSLSTTYYATARTIINEQQEENEEEELTWPQNPQQTPTQPSGIKKFVRSGLKLFSNNNNHNNKIKKHENNS